MTEDESQDRSPRSKLSPFESRLLENLAASAVFAYLAWAWTKDPIALIVIGIGSVIFNFFVLRFLPSNGVGCLIYLLLLGGLMILAYFVGFASA
ncbi:hypothetical protein OG884_28175 [Streptosporangium sp. NBC_01755]|uniref:hypothetical protein n=1 Tax=unclassified Streptosporangium TaxID=2632669 RepID=UPI002DDA166E|nr:MULTISPECIES: hypothetical protein [unclassified Streptosporangium]WSA23140.1 hypothetical protein OIE13_19400 [Streptosporangium sp. NBC_01810]WSC98715.1 hypothetical protein OG884_28175 [Streptosporangium sp. NBC_01755]